MKVSEARRYDWNTSRHLHSATVKARHCIGAAAHIGLHPPGRSTRRHPHARNRAAVLSLRSYTWSLVCACGRANAKSYACAHRRASAQGHPAAHP